MSALPPSKPIRSSPLRRAIPIVVTLALLAAGFVVFWMSQIAGVQSADTRGPMMSPQSPATHSSSLIGAGRGAWVVQYDRDTGRRSYQFKADFYDPQRDGTEFKVTRPVMQMFLNDGAVLQMQGIDGLIQVQPGTERSSMSGAPLEPPESGFFHKVVIKRFVSLRMLEKGAPELTIHMDNAQFDNDTFRLFTQEYTAPSGKVVLADQVPVTMQTADMDFVGSGLVMYWNDLTKQLTSLEVAHATRLTLYNAGDIENPTTAPSAQAAPATTRAKVAATAPATAPARQRYTATFYDHVRVFQGSHPSIAANVMYVDFLSGGDSSGNAATQPSAGDNSSGEAATQPAALRHGEPTYVYWTGKLRVVPAEPAEAAAEPLVSGKSIIRMFGSPVIVTPQPTAGGEQTAAYCDNLLYRTADGSARLTGARGRPILLMQTKTGAKSPDAMVQSQSLDYLREKQIAVFHGAGRSRFLDADDPKSVLTSTWQKSCVVHLENAAGGQMQIHSALLDGNVVANHPRFHLTSGQLALTFDAAPKPSQAQASSTNPQIKEVLATDHANCDLFEAGQQPRNIKAERLDLFTAHGDGGKVYAKEVYADGSVDTTQAGQTLRAQHLRATLNPAPAAPGAGAAAASSASSLESQPVQLHDLLAWQDVHVHGNDGSAASGQRLEMHVVEQHPRIKIFGAPAVASNADSTVTGPEIDMTPQNKISAVIGPGTLVTTQTNAAGGPPATRPTELHVRWSNWARMNGLTNRVNIEGDVHSESTAADGTMNRSHSQRVVLTLEDRPSTRPAAMRPAATRAAAARLAATRLASASSDPMAGEFDFMRDKQVQIVTLLNHAQMVSTLSRPDGEILKRSAIDGERIDYDEDARRLDVPGAGRLLSENHETPTTQSSATAPSDMGGRGITAIRWTDQFVYSELKCYSQIIGNVQIKHRDDGPNPRETQLLADRVDADLVPSPAVGANQPAPAADFGPGSSHLQISRVIATGQDQVDSGDKRITCGWVEYHPQSQILICKAGGVGIVTVTDKQRPGYLTFSQVTLDLTTNTLKDMIDANGQTIMKSANSPLNPAGSQ